MTEERKGPDVHSYWMSLDPQFARATLEVEYLDRNLSSANGRDWDALWSDWNGFRTDGDRIVRVLLNFPLGQALYLLRKLSEENNPLLQEIAVRPEAADCTGRIRGVIRRRLIIRMFEPARLVAFERALDGIGEAVS